MLKYGITPSGDSKIVAGVPSRQTIENRDIHVPDGRKGPGTIAEYRASSYEEEYERT